MADEGDTQTPSAGGAAGAPKPAEEPPVPEYELKSYDPVEFDMPKVSVSEEQVDQKLKEIAGQRGAQYVPTKRKVVGPREDIKLDIEVRRDGKTVPNVSAEDRHYTLGEGFMPESFDREVLGMTVGEPKTFTFKAPDYEDPNGAEREFEATVTVNKIMKKTVPEITDHWVKENIPQFHSAEELRDQVRKGLQDELDGTVENEKLQRAASALAERFEGKIDDYWYEKMQSDLSAQYEQQARAQGVDFEEFLDRQGMDDQKFSMMLMFQAREMLRQGFSLDAWARHYGLEPTDEDIRELTGMMVPAEHVDELIERANQDPKQKEALAMAARRHIANKDLVAKAKINYVDDPES